MFIYFFSLSVSLVSGVVGMARIDKCERSEEDKGSAKVVYIDYGTSESIPIDSLPPLPYDQFDYLRVKKVSCWTQTKCEN